ncbi:MAG: YicC family protein [Phycisphaerae bacterium]|nr:YicC family protein [Phycisphaerae bacterium]
MTGYGDSQINVDGVSYSLEIRSVNNRYFKALIKLPEHLQFFESEAEKLLRARMGRGSVSCVLRVRNDTATEYKINPGALQDYVNQICRVTLPETVHATLDLGSVAAMPGVCQAPIIDEEVRNKYWKVVCSLIEEALGKLVEMRRVEGAALCEDLLAHCARTREYLAGISERAPEIVQDYHQRLQTRVQMLLNEGEAKIELDQDALAREIAIYAERCDISEEITRLTSHLDQFCQLCHSRENTGRKLDFLAQEMLREANTIGSKSNDAQIARQVVEIKGLIDRLKEQVQNVE